MHRSASRPRLRGSARAVVAAVAAVSLVGCAGDPGLARSSLGHPEARRVQLGHSVEGRALCLDVWGAGPATTLVMGGIHGDESVASEKLETLGKTRKTRDSHLFEKLGTVTYFVTPRRPAR